MASTRDFVDFVVGQFDESCAVTSRMMFGEYALYSRGKLFALICDDQLFFKPTDGGRAYMGSVVEAPPYPGAKHSFLIRDQIDDGVWLSDLVRISVKELPEPKKKKSR
jgi:TfoX/Sxy family transcriptional regulator of competence genes